MSYINDTMQKGEEILVTPKLHWVNYVLPYLAMAAAGALVLLTFLLGTKDYGFLIVAAMLLIYSAYGFLELKYREMAVTNKREVVRKGGIASDGDEMKNIALTSIEVEQTVLGRIFNFGNVCFASAGSGRLVRLVFANVDNPRRLKAEIEDAIEESN